MEGMFGKRIQDTSFIDGAIVLMNCNTFCCVICTFCKTFFFKKKVCVLIAA